MKLNTLLFLIILLLMNDIVLANQLKNHSSPYLAMHGNDPVNWMEWGKPALIKAKKENKLLFVSIGYFACHWCHVMHRESYSNSEVAKILNKNYVAVKVDRELNPVLDKRLIEFVQLTNGTAGWPLNVFITPEGYPLVGATYLPRKQFISVLTQLSDKWKKDSKSLSQHAKNMSNTLVTLLEKQEQTTQKQNIKNLATKYLDVAMKYADTLQGGFGQQRKFPQIPQLWALIKLNQRKPNKTVNEFIQLTLNQMATKGLHDDIAGGFFRYTTDPDWEIPHFEKMQYTNAMMPLLYLDAANYYGNKQYRNIALETIKFITEEMKGKHNAYITSLSAVDSKGIEGGYYLWRQDELKKVLNPTELNIANLYWNLARPYEKPAGNLPRQFLTLKELAKKVQLTPHESAKYIQTIKLKLKSYRNKTRNIPRDTKLLAGINGLTLVALAKTLPYDKTLLESGDKLALFIMKLWNGSSLQRSDKVKQSGTLIDYAATAWGLIKWGRASNNQFTIETGIAIANQAWKKFYINNTWIENPESILPAGVNQAHIPDSAIFSPEVMLLKASLLSDNIDLKHKANNVMNNITRSVETDLFSYPSLLSLQEEN